MLCEKIVQRIDQTVNAQLAQTQSIHETGPTGESALAASSPTPNLKPEGKEKKGAKANEADERNGMRESAGHGALKLNGASINLENINIATYVCDFGNVIITKSAKKSFRLTNTGKIPITFNFDKKILNQAGITIEPDKAMKAAPNASVLFNVVYTTRKTSKFGR